MKKGFYLISSHLISNDVNDFKFNLCQSCYSSGLYFMSHVCVCHVFVNWRLKLEFSRKGVLSITELFNSWITVIKGLIINNTVECTVWLGLKLVTFHQNWSRLRHGQVGLVWTCCLTLSHSCHSACVCDMYRLTKLWSNRWFWHFYPHLAPDGYKLISLMKMTFLISLIPTFVNC